MAGKFSKLDSPVTTIHSNLDQAVIQITEDRLHLYLIEHIDKIENSKSWVTPASLLAAILTTFATTDFKGFAGLKAESWEAAFLLAGTATLIWLIRSLVRIRKAPTLKDLINNMKPGAPN